MGEGGKAETGDGGFRVREYLEPWMEGRNGLPARREPLERLRARLDSMLREMEKGEPLEILMRPYLPLLKELDELDTG